MDMNNFSIGIPIYNEERNIEKLLFSIKKQKYDAYSLIDIILYNDGSTDNTGKRVIEIMEKSKWFSEKIHFVSSQKNRGKAFGLKEIFNVSNSNFLVIIDSDMILENKNSLRKILDLIVEDECIGLSNGWYKIRERQGCLSMVLSFSLRMLKEVGIYKPLYVASGAIMVLRKKLYKKIIFSKKLVRVDAFIYFYTLKEGFKYKFNYDVTVLDSKNFDNLGIKWFMRAQNRSTKYPSVFYKFFEKKVVEDAGNLNIKIKILVLFKLLLRHPIRGGVYIMYKFIALVANGFIGETSSHLWRKK